MPLQGTLFAMNRSVESGTSLSALVPDVPAGRLETYAEFFVSAADISRVHVDEAGRYLGERSLPGSLVSDDEFTMVPCRYAGSRNARPMNISGLPGVTKHWPTVVHDALSLRARYVERVAVPRLPWVHVWLFGRTLTAVPAMLMRRDTEAYTRVPDRYAALFKPSIGLYMTTERAILGGIDPLATPTATEFLAVTESSGAFLSADAACSGPPHLVDEWLAAVLDGEITGGTRQAAEPMTPAEIELALDYGDAVSRLELLKLVYFCEVRLLLHHFAEVLAPLPGDDRAGLSAKGLDLTPADLRAMCDGLAGLASWLGATAPARVTDAAEVPGWQDEWATLFTAQQSTVDKILSRPPHDGPALAPADLARMAAYVDSTWSSTGLAARYDITTRLR
jgi:hypothetical protein